MRVSLEHIPQRVLYGRAMGDILTAALLRLKSEA
jgi:hypothetical protein